MFNDLVIYSDRSEAIANAVESVFPGAEHSFCIVHLERNIQAKWDKVNAPLTLQEDGNVRQFNKYMNYFTQARLSIDGEECKSFIERMKEIERSVNSESEIPVTDYIFQLIE